MKLAAAAIAVLLATPAIAQDADWTGFYFTQGLSSTKVTAKGESGSEDFMGVTVGLGYLKDAGAFSYGGEVAYQIDKSKDKSVDADIKSTAIRGIVGYEFGKNMVFASAGTLDSKLTTSGITLGDKFQVLGIGARRAFFEKYIGVIEFTRANKDNWLGSGVNLQNDTVSIRLDYKF